MSKKNIKLAERPNGEVKKTVHKLEVLVPLKFVENQISLWESLAEGEAKHKGQDYKVTIGHNWRSIWVYIEGSKGQLPKYLIDFDDLIQAAFNAAKEYDLINPKEI